MRLANFNELCDPCIKSKSTKTILQKYIIPTANKLEEVYTNL